MKDVTGARSDVAEHFEIIGKCGRSRTKSLFPKLNVAGSSPVSRSKKFNGLHLKTAGFPLPFCPVPHNGPLQWPTPYRAPKSGDAHAGLAPA